MKIKGTFLSYIASEKKSRKQQANTNAARQTKANLPKTKIAEPEQVEVLAY